MTSKYLVRFYFRTLLLGMITTALVSMVTEYENVTRYLFAGQFGEFLAGLIWFLGYGLLIATVSQVAFFIYLFIHPLGMGLFRKLWPYIQLLLVIYAVFDLFYVRFYRFGKEAGEIIDYIWIPIIVVIAGFIVAWWKDREARGTQVFIPSLFYMVFMTSIALLPFLNVEDTSWIYRSIFTLVAVNAFQLIMLPKYIEASEQEKRERGRVTKAERNEENRKAMAQRDERQKQKEAGQVKVNNKMKYKNKTRQNTSHKK
ncbi:KinB-signaling pathway activation protein [Salinicoccus sp. CNSTN-B1]